MKTSLSLIANKALNKMLHQNPDRKISHNTCDWVVENFLDYCRSGQILNTDQIDTLEEFWFKSWADSAPLKLLTDEFQVRDALEGNVSGDYAADLKRLNLQGKTTYQMIYQYAYQNTMQP